MIQKLGSVIVAVLSSLVVHLEETFILTLKTRLFTLHTKRRIYKDSGNMTKIVKRTSEEAVIALSGIALFSIPIGDAHSGNNKVKYINCK